MAPLLEFKNVTKVYSRGLLSKSSTTALADVSLQLDAERPTIMTVAGESGSGKTTMAMLLLGFIQPTSGQILYKGQDISKLRGNDAMQFRREVQAVFQDPFAVFNPFYTVDHLLTVPINRFKLAKSKQEERDIMYQALSSVGLRPEDVLGKYPHQVSGGQRQRINVARALVLQPKLLVADEPVSMVDASLRASILETLRGLQRDHGVSIIYITHDLTTAYHIARSIMVLYRGGIMEAGSVDTIIKNPQHPYTRLLIDSIPWPDLNRRWGNSEIKAREMDLHERSAGCKFASRCPFAFEACKNPPPLFRMSEQQVTSCFLQQGNPQVSGEQLSDLMRNTI